MGAVRGRRFEKARGWLQVGALSRIAHKNSNSAPHVGSQSGLLSHTREAGVLQGRDAIHRVGDAASETPIPVRRTPRFRR